MGTSGFSPDLSSGRRPESKTDETRELPLDPGRDRDIYERAIHGWFFLSAYHIIYWERVVAFFYSECTMPNSFVLSFLTSRLHTVDTSRLVHFMCV